MIGISTEFGELLQGSGSLASHKEQPLGIDTIAKFEAVLAQQFGEVAACDQRLAVEADKLTQELKTATQLELTSTELAKILRRSLRSIKEGIEQGEIEEIAERQPKGSGSNDQEEPITSTLCPRRDLCRGSTGVDLEDFSSFEDDIPQVSTNVNHQSAGAPLKIRKPADEASHQVITSILNAEFTDVNGKADLNISAQLPAITQVQQASCVPRIDYPPTYSIAELSEIVGIKEGEEEEKIILDEVNLYSLRDSQAAPKMQQASIIHAQPSSTSNFTETLGALPLLRQEIRADQQVFEGAVADSSEMAETSSLSVTLPVEVNGVDEAFGNAQNRTSPGRINWEKSLLTVSIREQDGMTRVALFADTGLQEILTKAREHFEGELQSLFNLKIEINEVYQDRGRSGEQVAVQF